MRKLTPPSPKLPGKSIGAKERFYRSGDAWSGGHDELEFALLLAHEREIGECALRDGYAQEFSWAAIFC
ncbi:hypothetical protein V6N11_051072 [Hibiscus sabdariffa]|uniref:Uncharacterized protein n=1 Tax=Hibiscus sabdariffa TaxID=183260 RepID=A0ABR2R2S4_9ROSI